MIIWLIVKQGSQLKKHQRQSYPFFVILVRGNCQNETSEATFVYRRV